MSFNEKYIYLSHFIDSDTPTYGNRSKIELKQTSNTCCGDTANSYSISMSSNHIGTHIDLPNHFYDVNKNIAFYDPSTWMFKKIGFIEYQCLEPKLIDLNLNDFNINPDIDLLLVKTGYETFRLENKYWELYPSFKLSFIKKVKQQFKHLRAIGFDFISLTSPLDKEEGKNCHLELLDPKNEIFIIEDMKLSTIKSKIKHVIVSPWQINNIDSAPVTVIAKEE